MRSQVLPAILPAMTKAQAKAIRVHRKRLANRGIARVEVRVPHTDAALIRQVAADLLDEETRDATRRWLREHTFDTSSLKALLTSGPAFEVEVPRRSGKNRAVRF
jgi:hypothetical protein